MTISKVMLLEATKWFRGLNEFNKGGFMIAGGDSNCYVGKTFYSESAQERQACLKRLIGETQKPLAISTECGFDRIAGTTCVDTLVVLKQCRKGEEYYLPFGGNIGRAIQCVQALTLLTGMQHGAVLLQARKFFADTYTVALVEK